MRRVVSWLLAISGLAVVGVLLASVTGHLTEKQQLHLVGRVIAYGCVFVLPVVVLVNVVREFRASGDWKAWLQFAAALLPFVGFWAWRGYFAEHGAFIIWPVICFVVFWALIIAHGRAGEKRKKEYAAWLRESTPPLPEPTSGEPSDDELRRRGLL
jgi:hypothetical protein